MVPWSGDGEVEATHLPGACREDLESLADVVLSFGGRLYLAHSQVLAVASAHLASLVALRRETAPEGRGPPLCLLPSSQPNSVPEGVREATSEEFSSFLRLLYRSEPRFQWDTLSGVLQLADYFGVSDVLLQADAWLCEQYAHPAAPLKPPQAAAAFRLASRHRLGGATALLLPWALQCLARGSRCCAVWHDGRQVCEALRLAFEDSQLKCLALDAYWWSKEAQEGCTRCPCRPADIAGSWDTRLEWAAPIHPGMGVVAGGGASLAPGSAAHARAAQHYAHLLRDASWANTPPERACSLLATAAAAAGRVQ